MSLKLTKERVKEILGMGFDDEGYITVDIDDINKLMNESE